MNKRADLVKGLHTVCTLMCLPVWQPHTWLRHQHDARGSLCWWFTKQFHLCEVRRPPHVWSDSSTQGKEELSRFILTFTLFLQEKAFYLARLENLWFMYKCPFCIWEVRNFSQEMEDADKSLWNNPKILQKFHLLVKLVMITQKCFHTRRQNMESLRE